MPRKRKTELPPLNINQETSIGSRIASFRKKKGYTQSDLAEEIGIKRTLVTDYEIGRLHLSDEMIIRFSLALGVCSDEILGLKDHNTEDSTSDLKLTKRLKAIEELSPSDQKKVLQNLDLILQGIKNK
jgi:transcriptional regulator with XRE-family HTH domain